MYLALLYSKDNAETVFKIVLHMDQIHSSAQNAQMDSDLIQDYVLLLTPSAQDILFKRLLNFANHVFQDITYHKEFVLKIKLDAFILAQFAQVVLMDLPMNPNQRLASFLDAQVTLLLDVLPVNLHSLSRITAV